MTLLETVGVALLTVVASSAATLFGQWVIARLNRESERRKFVREKLHDRHAEFVASAFGVLHMAKVNHDAIATAGEEPVYEPDAGRQQYDRQVALTQVAFQIQLLEPNPALVTAVRGLVDTIPWVPRCSGVEDLSEYGQHIDMYEQLLHKFTETVMLAHASNVIGKVKAVR